MKRLAALLMCVMLTMAAVMTAGGEALAEG